jgi:hypothetical protein
MIASKAWRKLTGTVGLDTAVLPRVSTGNHFLLPNSFLIVTFPWRTERASVRSCYHSFAAPTES